MEWPSVSTTILVTRELLSGQISVPVQLVSSLILQFEQCSFSHLFFIPFFSDGHIHFNHYLSGKRLQNPYLRCQVILSYDFFGNSIDFDRRELLFIVFVLPIFVYSVHRHLSNAPFSSFCTLGIQFVYKLIRASLRVIYVLFIKSRFITGRRVPI